LHLNQLHLEQAIHFQLVMVETDVIMEEIPQHLKHQQMVEVEVEAEIVAKQAQQEDQAEEVELHLETFLEEEQIKEVHLVELDMEVLVVQLEAEDHTKVAAEEALEALDKVGRQTVVVAVMAMVE
jgi:hypothetical protein